MMPTMARILREVRTAEGMPEYFFTARTINTTTAGMAARISSSQSEKGRMKLTKDISVLRAVEIVAFTPSANATLDLAIAKTMRVTRVMKKTTMKNTGTYFLLSSLIFSKTTSVNFYR